jgi:hypothetical protein
VDTEKPCRKVAGKRHANKKGDRHQAAGSHQPPQCHRGSFGKCADRIDQNGDEVRQSDKRRGPPCETTPRSGQCGSTATFGPAARQVDPAKLLENQPGTGQSATAKQHQLQTNLGSAGRAPRRQFSGH